MDFSKEGWKVGVIKASKVAGWVALSGAIVALSEYVRGIDVPADNYVLVATVGLVNALLAGAKDWVTTKK